jgi:hypothetical protein
MPGLIIFVSDFFTGGKWYWYDPILKEAVVFIDSFNAIIVGSIIAVVFFNKIRIADPNGTNFHRNNVRMAGAIAFTVCGLGFVLYGFGKITELVAPLLSADYNITTFIILVVALTIAKVTLEWIKADPHATLSEKY